MSYQEVKGDLIKLSLEGKFDVITHGCNCFCTMGAGIAPQMAKTFGADKFPLEVDSFKGSINKLGMIDYQKLIILENGTGVVKYGAMWVGEQVIVINAYTQYGFGSNHEGGVAVPLDYEALTLCLKKINHTFKGKNLGLPMIGCGLGGADWNIVKQMIQKELKDMKVTVVIYAP